MKEAFTRGESRAVNERLGAQLRQARLRRRLSLRTVSEALGVSPSLISQIEMGKTQPSVSTLYAAASYLEVSTDELLGLPPIDSRLPFASRDVQSAADNVVIEMENGVRWERLATSYDCPIDTVLVTYAPGSSSSVDGKLMRHGGMESAYLIEGELTLQLEFHTYTLRPGDSLQFDSARPHMYANLESVPARGIWSTFGDTQERGGEPAALVALHRVDKAGTAAGGWVG